MRPINSFTAIETAKKASLSPPAMAQPRSPWHSPVPYLFGGLAAMLGLIAFALLILACSYWRLSGRLDSNNNESEERDVENGDGEKESDSNKQIKVYEEKILVIMAGQEKPTFLATPVSTKGVSFGDKNGKLEDNEGTEKAENGEKVKENQMVDDHDEQLPTISENTESEQTQNQI
ncbi:hypothetical protein CCACVL1_09756 [Corchorus capsularis]|uniref:Uncharacterized protein n=1 Tax=Corchorus capsularis TaxID=210143 RepID=A0A1R3IUC0_COCAP|nr:hypothetical protein CCACVL1_09756 [Corchorus capsularis]